MRNQISQGLLFSLPTQTIITKSPEETQAWAAKFAESLSVGSVVALTGDLGAGKTQFAKGLGKGLGIEEMIVSPTFNYLLEYKGRLPLYHADLYRIESPYAFRAMGFDEYFTSEGIFVAEWAERVKELFPKGTIWIEFQTGSDLSERVIRISRSET